MRGMRQPPQSPSCRRVAGLFGFSVAFIAPGAPASAAAVPDVAPFADRQIAGAVLVFGLHDGLFRDRWLYQEKRVQTANWQPVALHRAAFAFG
jgi:hypothetical protein